jgi:hypothetical protein
MKLRIFQPVRVQEHSKQDNLTLLIVDYVIESNCDWKWDQEFGCKQ